MRRSKRPFRKRSTYKILTCHPNNEEGKKMAEVYRKHYGGIIKRLGNKICNLISSNLTQTSPNTWTKGNWTIILLKNKLSVPNVIVKGKGKNIVLSLNEIKQLLSSPLAWERYRSIPKYLRADLYDILKEAVS